MGLTTCPNCKTNSFNVTVRVSLIDLSDPVKDAVRILQERKQHDRIQSPELLAKIRKVLPKSNIYPNGHPTPHFFAYAAVQAMPLAICQEIKQHANQCWRCGRINQVIQTEIGQHEHTDFSTISVAMLNPSMDEFLQSYSTVSCAYCNIRYSFNNFRGLESVS
jgi:hypothetical protein